MIQYYIYEKYSYIYLLIVRGFYKIILFSRRASGWAVLIEGTRGVVNQTINLRVIGQLRLTNCPKETFSNNNIPIVLKINESALPREMERERGRRRIDRRR